MTYIHIHTCMCMCVCVFCSEVLLVELVPAMCQTESLYNTHFHLLLDTSFEFWQKATQQAAKHRNELWHPSVQHMHMLEITSRKVKRKRDFSLLMHMSHRLARSYIPSQTVNHKDSSKLSHRCVLHIYHTLHSILQNAFPLPPEQNYVIPL